MRRVLVLVGIASLVVSPLGLGQAKPPSPTSSIPVPVSSGGTGSTTQNFVDLTNPQTVAGNKQMTSTTTLGATPNGGNWGPGSLQIGPIDAGTIAVFPPSQNTVTVNELLTDETLTHATIEINQRHFIDDGGTGVNSEYALLGSAETHDYFNDAGSTSGQGTVFRQAGVVGEVTSNHSGTTTQQRAIQGYAVSGNSSTVATSKGGDFGCQTTSASSTINACFGVQTRNYAQTGKMVSAVGVGVSMQTAGANSFGLLVDSSDPPAIPDAGNIAYGNNTGNRMYTKGDFELLSCVPLAAILDGGTPQAGAMACCSNCADFTSPCQQADGGNGHGSVYFQGSAQSKCW